MQLTKNFTLAEMLHSDDAIKYGIDNSTDDPEIIQNLLNLCIHIMQPTRDHFGKIKPSSGYRSPALNSHKKINGSKNSQHCFGEACDFKIPGIPNIDVARWMITNLTFDQIILEFPSKDNPNAGWIHGSWSSKRLRHEVLTSYKISVGGKLVTRYMPGLIV